MNTPSNPGLLQRWRRARRSPREQEPADLGTAFGLEVSLGDAPSRDEPAAPDPVARAGWLARLAGRPPKR